MPDGKLTLGTFHVGPFLKLLAKIALSFAIASGISASSIHPMLPEIILGRSDTKWYLVGGGWPSGEPTDGDGYSHSLRLREIVLESFPDTVFTIALIHLFGQLGLPKYHVVIGQSPVGQRHLAAMAGR